MAKKKILKDFKKSTPHSCEHDSELIVPAGKNPDEFYAQQAFIFVIEAITECLAHNNPKGIVDVLDGYRMETGKKIMASRIAGGTSFTADQIKKLTAAARMITIILHPPNRANKKLAKPIAKIVIKKQRRVPLASNSYQRPGIRASSADSPGKKRSV